MPYLRRPRRLTQRLRHSVIRGLDPGRALADRVPAVLARFDQAQEAKATASRHVTGVSPSQVGVVWPPAADINPVVQDFVRCCRHNSPGPG